MPNLAEILRTGYPKDEVGVATELKEAGMPAAGVDRMAAVIAAMANKLLEVLVFLYGSDSEQGKRVLRAVKIISPMTKGITAEDIGNILKVLEGVVAKGPVPPEMMTMMRPTTGPMPPPTGPIPIEEERTGSIPTPPTARRVPGIGGILREERRV